MTDQDKERVWLLLKISAVGTLISIPLGIWALKKWPNETYKTAAFLTLVSFGVREVMLRKAE
jgi:hypothetical protein